MVGAQLNGLGIASSMPVVAADTPLNEERAIVGRVLNTPYQPDPLAWEALSDDILDLEFEGQPVFPRKIVRAVAFELWNSRFPLNRQKR